MCETKAMMQLAAVPMTRWLPRGQLTTHLAGVDPSRAERLERFRLDEDFQRGLMGCLLLRYMVRRFTPASEGALLLGMGEFGKPYLVEYPELHFSLSHSGTWVVCALSSSPVGIDVEEIKSMDLDNSAPYFTCSEHSDLLSKAPADRLGHFFNLWTAKESYVKMTGAGLKYPLNGFAVVWSESGNAHIVSDDHRGNDVQVAVSDVLERYKLAVCARLRPELETLESIPMERLLGRWPPDSENYGSKFCNA